MKSKNSSPLFQRMYLKKYLTVWTASCEFCKLVWFAPLAALVAQSIKVVAEFLTFAAHTVIYYFCTETSTINTCFMLYILVGEKDYYLQSNETSFEIFSWRNVIKTLPKWTIQLMRAKLLYSFFGAHSSRYRSLCLHLYTINNYT